ncbi:MAG TPA: TonB-dependent receptor [Bryobacteraceae bacterium]
MLRSIKSGFPVCIAALIFAFHAQFAAGAEIAGRLTDPQGQPVAHGAITLGPTSVATNANGRFSLPAVPPGTYAITADAPGFAHLVRALTVSSDSPLTIDLQFAQVAARSDAMTVTADVRDNDIQQPDPAQRVLVREELLDANPGRPGAPVSIPGIPIETASSGIKAPQYFAPGVAGDHGEPVAQYIELGTYLLPNNLSANAHGNGYADPNLMVPATIESVQTDGGSFNVREGDHSVDLAATYVLHPRLQPYLTLTADYRDVDLSAGWNWIAIQASYGNGFLDTLEHRQQYKVNIFKNWTLGSHNLALLGIGYYGQSRIPGLVPIDVPNLHDTIDPRQRDQTHTGEVALNDTWHLDPRSELQLSSFFRTYNLALYSDFGDGLIRQSEFRTVTGDNATYVRRVNPHLSFMAGFDYLREAPRRDDLDRYLSINPFVYVPFQQVTANNITLNLLTPFVAAQGRVWRWLHYNLGWRRDQILFSNTDLLYPQNSFSKWAGINSPKATLSFVPAESSVLPSVSASFGQSFFTNDPRIGTGVQQGSLVSQAHAYQLVISKSILKTDFRVTLAHVTQEASLAKIDPDTGLQFDEGPSVNRYLTVSARRYFGIGSLEASFSKADARDLSDGTPIPEAPRMILDVLGTLDRLPFHLHARAEFEEVGSKPLGDGFVGVPVREFRGSLVRSFARGKVQTGVQFQIASGYTGQTTEVLEFERVVGVFIPSYATVSASYRFGK